MTNVECRTKSEARSPKFAVRGFDFGFWASGFFRILGFGFRISDSVGEFHHVIKSCASWQQTERENIYQAIVGTGNRFEFLKPLELALEGFGSHVPIAPDDLHGT